MDSLLFSILFLPLAGALINGIAGNKLSKRLVAFIGNITVFSSFGIAVYLFFHLSSLSGASNEHAAITGTLFSWIDAGYIHISFTLLFDHLSAVMTLIITGVGAFIHLYSIGYMEGDRSFARYFAYLNLFIFSMLLLVLGDNMLLLFVGWEGVGLCSYLLIGFWFEDMDKAIAGKKAFLVNRIGDFGFILGIFLLLFFTGGKLSFPELSLFFANSPVSAGVVTTITLLLFVGATGKSAQIPLFVWLPDAMAGPTPVSALIHAATMVTAGVYMITRLNFMFVLAPVTMAIVAGIGALTAFFAATIGIAQNDIKKVLAYSTISQLGYMFIAVGSGAFSAGIFHLMTHAFFKATLFLCAGAIIHSMGGVQDIRKMGGLAKKFPITHITFLIAALAISGVPFFSGFFSKDEILWRSFSNRGLFSPILSTTYYVLGASAALITAFYMFRLYFLTFLGDDSRIDPDVLKHIHKPHIAMRTALIVLGTLSAVGGFIGMPFEKLNLFKHWLEPSISEAAMKIVTVSHNQGLEFIFMGISVLLAVIGIWLAYIFYMGASKKIPNEFATKFPSFYNLVLDKYRIDELYQLVIIKPFTVLSNFFYKLVDKIFIDLLSVNGAAAGVKLAGKTVRYWQTGNIQQYLAIIISAVAVLLFYIYT